MRSYDPQVVRSGLARALEPLGGMSAFIARGDRVLLKPNFLSPKGVDAAVCTHPELILAVGEAALDAGASKVMIGDSPGLGSASAIARRLGLAKPAKERGLLLQNFDNPTVIENKEGARFKRFELEKTVFEVDKIINLPKVKTHGQMFLTLAVKNMFGCVVGMRKGAWHLEAGRDEDLFAAMLLDLHYLVRPALHIVDGIIMMEGNGPGAGEPRPLGALLAGTDAVSLDSVICERLLHLPLERLNTHQVAIREGIGAADQIEMVGVAPDVIAIHDVAHPRYLPVGDFYVPQLLRGVVRKLVEVRPVVAYKKCDGCSICENHCPAKAIQMSGTPRDNKPTANIDQEACIHCYCCQEVCPEGAISPRRGLARRLFRSLGT